MSIIRPGMIKPSEIAPRESIDRPLHHPDIVEEPPVTLNAWLAGDVPVTVGKKRIYKKKDKPEDLERFDKSNPYEIGRRMRASFWNGVMELCKRQRKSLHEVIADWLEADQKGTFQMMSGFFPKQVDNNVGGDLISYLKEIEQNRAAGRTDERVVSEQSGSEKSATSLIELNRAG